MAPEHLVKLRASPAADPRAGCEITVMRANRAIELKLKDSPSRRSAVSDMIAGEMPSARKLVESILTAYGEAPCVEIGSLTYSPDEVLGDWFP
jgi:hypothetical protein